MFSSGSSSTRIKPPSEMDSDYKLPNHVQKKSRHETPESSPKLTRSTSSNQLETEEKTRRLLEAKINRYPLRNYINLGTGFNVQARPNYYESDEEEEVVKEENPPMRRRHSIAAPASREEEEENGEVSNLCRNINLRKRRYSEGSANPLLKEEIFSDTSGKSVDKQDSVCITRTVTYTSKEQVVKYYQTQNLILNPAQSQAVGKQFGANNRGNRRELTDIVDNICRGTIPTNGPLYEVRGKRQLLDYEKEAHKEFPLLQNDKNSIQNKTEIKCMDSPTQNLKLKECFVENSKDSKSDFLVLLELQEQCSSNKKICQKEAENKNTALTCMIQISDKEVELTEESACLQDKNKQDLEKDEDNKTSQVNENKSVSHEYPSTRSKSVDFDTKSVENTRVKVNNKTEEAKALNDKPNLPKKSLSKKIKDTNLNIMKKNCDELFHPDLLPIKKSISIKIGTKSNKKIVPKKAQDNSKQTTTRIVNKKKVTWHREAGLINRPTDVMPEGKQKTYSMNELKRKLVLLFEEPLNKSILERSMKNKKEQTVGCDLNTKGKKVDHQNNTDTHQNNRKEKPTRHCLLHKKKANSEKRVKRELETIKQPKISSDKKKLHLPTTRDVAKTRNKIELLRKKRRILCKIKSVLEKTWCSNVCPKHSRFKITRYKKNAKQCNLPVTKQNIGHPTPNVVGQSEHPLERQANADLQISRKNNLEISESNLMNEKISVVTEEAAEDKPKDLSAPSEKTAHYDNVEIVQNCCCCSPQTRTEESANEDRQSLKLPEEKEKLDVISLCENSMDGMDSENLTPYIDCCCCCGPPSGTEKKHSTCQDKLESREIIIIDITDDVAEENSTNIFALNKNDTETKPNPPPTDTAGKAAECNGSSNSEEVVNVINFLKVTSHAGQMNNSTDTGKNSATRIQNSPESMFFEESEDRDLQELIKTLTDNIDSNPSSPQTTQTENECIAKNSNAQPTTDDVQVNMTGMEHYKKRLIHQHEKPGTATSPCTTTITATEEEDSLESPLSPASSVQSRDSGSREKRKEEVVQKVARKRAVCRSQFRHQNMELFKLGSSIPTSLCKTKEPYNVCAEKNLQLCYQNGVSKKCDKNPSKDLLTDSILNTMDGGKRKDAPLWRSISLTNEAENKNLSSNSGRHILPAMVPELPEHRRSRIKSLPENLSKTVTDNAKEKRGKNGPGNVYEFVEENEAVDTRRIQHAVNKGATIRQKSSVGIEDVATVHQNRKTTTSQRESSDMLKASLTDASTTQRRPEDVIETPYVCNESAAVEAHGMMGAYRGNVNIIPIIPRRSTFTGTLGIVPAHSQNMVRRSVSSEFDADDCVPMNLSLKDKGDATSRPSWTDLVKAHQAKRNEVNNNQHLTNAVPRQPRNVPKKPQQESLKKDLDENIVSALASEGAHVDKDGNCFFVASIPGSALDPQKQSNVIVINFPHIQQQMARMEKPQGLETPLDMLDSAIMSLVNIVKSSVESVFNVMSLPVLNRLYIDLNRYLVLPTVSLKMKMRIDEALNSLIMYLLANLFRTPCAPKTRDFVHKMLLLDLRPHMDFLINSLGMIQQKIKYDYFAEELLKFLSCSPQENHIRAQRQYFSAQNQQPFLDFRDYRGNNLWMENSSYHYDIPPYEVMSSISPQKRGRRPTQEGQNGLPVDARIPENFSAPNLPLMRPDLYLADNRCVPPNRPPFLPEPFYRQSASQPRPKGRPRNLSRINKTAANKHDMRLIIENITDLTSRSVDNVNPEAPSSRNSDVLPLEEPIGDPARCGDGSRPLNCNVRQELNQKRQNGGTGPLSYMPVLAPPGDATMDLSMKKAPRRDVPNETPLKAHGAAKVVILGNEIVQRKDQNEDARLAPANGQTGATSERENAAKQFAAPDVEQYLHTNIILNKNQTPTVIRGTVVESENPNKRKSVLSEHSSDQDDAFSLKLVNPEAGSEPTENVGKHEAAYCSKRDVSGKDDGVISSTVIIKDNSMEVSKGGVSSLHSRALSSAMDLDDVVLEKVNSKDGNSCATTWFESLKTSKAPNENTKAKTDVSIEKVNDLPPKLIKLTSLKRRLTQDEKRQKKPKVKGFECDEVVIIEDDEQTEEVEKLDCNQNNVGKSSHEVTETNSFEKQENGSVSSDKSEKPIIEDISSEEETLQSFRLYSAYENKLADDPRKILQTTEVSHCTLIPGNVKAVQNANWHLFQKTPVYTRPVLPRKHRKLSLDVDLAPKREPLLNLVRFEEGRDSFACSLNLKNSELKNCSSMDVRRFSTPESESRTPSFKSPPRPMAPSPVRARTSPVTAKLSVVQSSPATFVPRSPGIRTSPVVQTSPVMFVSRSPVVQTSPVAQPKSPLFMAPSVVRTSPVLAPRLPQLPAPPVVQTSPLNERNANWGHWFSEEQQKGMFNFEGVHSLEARRQSTEMPNVAPEEPYCEIKIDSKTYKIKKNLLERIPKGKLCYVRESNTFVRYFDNNQMELFISNLNLGEGSTVAKDLLKQVRGRADSAADVETPPEQCEPAQKGEVIALAKDVVFSKEDYLSDPELYVEEVEKVQRYAPKDFYGFYKFVTGYQIVNHHPPISFQTFLTMHNTNGIRGLFKNYVNTLVEGRNIL